MATLLHVPTAQNSNSSNSGEGHTRKHLSKTRRIRTLFSMKPDEYASAVREYSRLPTGAGQNHIPLAEFLNSEAPTTIVIEPQHPKEDLVTLYPLEIHDESSPSPSQSTSHLVDQENAGADGEPPSDRRQETRKHSSFRDPNEFYHHSFGARIDSQSCVIFMRGYMTSAWIKHIGGRFTVDPEFFSRHIDMELTDNDSNNFSLPALPSTSCHLIELPIITLGSHGTVKGAIQQHKIEELRRIGKEQLADHHHNISKLAASDMALGDSIVREYFVFDETHFAIEQRISICMQGAEDGKRFTLLVWLDSGHDLTRAVASRPWAVDPPRSDFLPIIRHKYMVALKSHLFASSTADEADSSPRQAPNTSHLVKDFGRSLRPNLMATNAFYCLTEIFSIAASSQMQFLNLVDIKLDKYISQPPENEYLSLPNLKYTKQILYRNTQKIQRVLDSIRNAKHSRWPKAGGTGAEHSDSSSSFTPTHIASQNLEKDFAHLLLYSTALHKRTTEAIADLRASIAISESQKSIQQTRRIGRLTFLAFIFVPFSFTTSFFGMNVKELGNGNLGIEWWLVMTVLVTGAAVILFFVDFNAFFKDIWKKSRAWRELKPS